MKRMIQKTWMACIVLMCVCFASCNDDAIVEASQSNETGQPFRLTASQETPSRLELGQDGMTIQWEPGDQLVLVKKDRSIVPIYMNAELDEPSTSATFVSETGVPAGEYWVVYNYNEHLVYEHRGFASIDEINNRDNLVLWGELTVSEGDTDATIALQHLYAKVRVELQNLPSNDAYYTIGMYASKIGFPVYQQLTQNGIENVDNDRDGYDDSIGYKATNRRYHNIRFGHYNLRSYWDEASGQYITRDKTEVEKNSVLLLPADVSSGTVYFYILDGMDCYEISKSNLVFEAGKNYKVVLDMATAKKTTLTSTEVTLPGYSYPSSVYQLTSIEDCRHAAYRGNYYNKYALMNDIDFAEDTFLPITASYVYGNEKTLKNVSIEWDEEDYVGLVKYDYDMGEAGGEPVFSSIDLRYRSCWVSNLILENVKIKGLNYVGALSGTNVMVNDCKLTGTSSIISIGDYVGGLVGCNYMTYSADMNGPVSISNSSIEGTCTVNGNNYVGGFVGKCGEKIDYYGEINLSSSLRLFNSCSSAATVTATGDYAGGIFGAAKDNSIQFSSEDYSLSLYGCAFYVFMQIKNGLFS